MDQETPIKNEEIVEVTMKPKPKKKHKFLRRFMIFIVINIVIILILGFMMPGLLWTKSLGVTYTKADYDSMMSKLQYVKDAVPTGDSEAKYNYVFGVAKPIEVSFTSAEITSFLNMNRPSYFAVKNVQVKINNDGSIEASGAANVDYFLNEVLGSKYSRDQIKKEIPALGFLPSSVNLYLSFEGSVTNNISTGSLKSVSVQGIPIPTNYVASSEAIQTLTNGVNNLMTKYNNKTGSNFDKIAVVDGKILFKGRVPSSLERIIK